MNTETVIFVTSSQDKVNVNDTRNSLITIPPPAILNRIYLSFMPPIGKRHQKVYTDLVGPLLALILLYSILHYGHKYKNHAISVSPITFILAYTIIIPVSYYFLCKVARSDITFIQFVSLWGYAMYGYIFTLIISLLLFDEKSNTFFFLCLIIFGGLSTFRLSIIVLKTIPKPAARLVVCSLIAIVQILCLVFVHFAYMHRTYVHVIQHKEYKIVTARM